MAEKVIVADCSTGNPYDGIEIRDETSREKNERMDMVNKHAARVKAIADAEADQQAAKDEIAAAAAKDPNAPLAAGLVARALGLK